MRRSTATSWILLLGAVSAVHAAEVVLENTIPSGNLELQPPILTGAGLFLGNGGGVLADGFTPAVSATLDQIGVFVGYDDFPSFGVDGQSPIVLTLFTDNADSRGTPIESWTVPINDNSPFGLEVTTVDSVLHPMLLAGQQYWLSEVPEDPLHTGVGWFLASAGYPGIELPITGNTMGTNNAWAPTEVNLANEFDVLGTAVPEPAFFVMDALALTILLVCGGHKQEVLQGSKTRLP